MRFLLTLTAAVAAAATLATAPIDGASKAVPQQHVLRSDVSQVRNLRHSIPWHRTMTWHYQDERGVRRTVSAYMERRTRSVPYLRWDNQLWTHRQIRAKHALAAHRLPLTNDWATAVRVVQRDWPGTADWLLSCSGGEGGHGIWVWNGGAPYDSPNHGSGVGGWMQYAPGTWSGQFSSALREAVQRHLALPLQKTSSWLSPIGQAFAAGWSRFHHATSAWDPGIDPACA